MLVLDKLSQKQNSAYLKGKPLHAGAFSYLNENSSSRSSNVFSLRSEFWVRSLTLSRILVISEIVTVLNGLNSPS